MGRKTNPSNKILTLEDIGVLDLVRDRGSLVHWAWIGSGTGLVFLLNPL